MSRKEDASSLESTTWHSACRRKALGELLLRKPLPPALRKGCQLIQHLSAVKVGADLIREDASTVEFCQLVTFDHNRCCFSLTSVFPAIWDQMSVKEHNQNHYMLICTSAPLPEPRGSRQSWCGLE